MQQLVDHVDALLVRDHLGIIDRRTLEVRRDARAANALADRAAYLERLMRKWQGDYFSYYAEVFDQR